MNGDLISRSDLIEALRAEADECEESRTSPSFWTALKIVKEQPISYDVDKVVAELEELKAYRDAEEQRFLLRLPFKIGDDVYQIPSKTNYELNVLQGHNENNRVYHQNISKVVNTGHNWYLECDKDREYGTGRICLDIFFGETWFLSKEEAEQKLAEMRGE